MAARRALFREVDLKRALRAARSVGCEEVRVECDPDGRMIVTTGRAAAVGSKANSFDGMFE